MNETMEQKLLRVVAENPGIKILPCVDYDVCCDDSFSWWIGQINNVSVKTRVLYDGSFEGKVFFDEDDSEEIKEDIENYGDDFDSVIIQSKYDNLPREKVIVLKIGVPS